jgi:1,4-alpha-glucan branching enzyme
MKTAIPIRNIGSVNHSENSAFQKILEARHHDPFDVLGRHPQGDEDIVRVFLPHAHEVLLEGRHQMQRVDNTDLFQWRGPSTQLPQPYQLSWKDDAQQQHTNYDPYCFSPQIGDLDLHLFAEGKHQRLYRVLGAHCRSVEGVAGVLFATWAPNAERVSMVGDFNHWDGRCHPLRSRGGSGVWELFIPGLGSGDLYKFEIRDQGGHLHLKTDPYGRQFELRPGTASIIETDTNYRWQDENWLKVRQQYDWQHQPLSIYEVHLGSWKREDGQHFLNYAQLSAQLIPYVKQQGFTHLQLLPITEHPLDASWGYQTTGYFAPTSRFGNPDEFRAFIDHCHAAGIGILLDWVPAHFPKDAHGLARFDGSALYEHEDPRLGEHQDWGTLIYNYSRNEVKNFLIASALFWLEEFHIDGLRVDAVASMIYLNYSRKEGEWLPNRHGGNENLEAIDFLRQLNNLAHQRAPGVLMIAEESTAWPQVSRPTWLGGLGFSMKWNMGWMHDILDYLKKDPVHRHFHQDQLTFGLLYAFTENFVLPFSHDEVVHGKSSLRYRMPGDEWQQFANLRLLYTFMFTYPGKKLLFMGNEFGQGAEWNHDAQLDWHVLDYPLHHGLQKLVGDLNQLYCNETALHYFDFESRGFQWIDCHDAAQSIVSYLREDDDGNHIIVIVNFTPVIREHYRIGLPASVTPLENGRRSYEVIFNSDSQHYGGSNAGSGNCISVENTVWMSHACSLTLTLPPLAGLVLKMRPASEDKNTPRNSVISSIVAG